MEKTNIKVEIYKTKFASKDGNIMIEIDTLDDEYEAYIYATENAIKEHIYSVPKDAQTYEEFVEMVGDSLAGGGYIKGYLDRYSLY